MALKVEKGVITSPGSTGNQTTNLADTGFGTVKALLLWATYETAATADTGANAIMSIGFGTYRSSAVAQWCENYFDTDGAGTSSCAGGATSSSILHALSAVTPTTDYDVSLVSLGNAQFVLNWTDLPGTASIKVHYLALGGADITDALVGTFDIPAATGTVNETVATGFGQPDLLLAIPAGTTTEGDGVQSAQIGLGAGMDDSNELHSTFQNETGRPSMEPSSHQTATFVAFISNDTSVYFEASLSAVASWPTDGFQVNVTTAPADPARVGYLALKGSFAAAIGTNTAPTAAPTVTQDLAVGGTPRGGIFFHNSIAANAGLDNSHADLGTFGFGATDGTNEGWAGVGQDDANASSVSHRHHSESKSIKMFTPSAAGTLASEADASVSGNNIRLSWADTDTVAREYCYVVFGDGAADTPLNAEPGSYAVTGAAATVTAGRAVSADPGVYAVTGQTATLLADSVLALDPGVYAVTGAAATLLTARVLSADPGVYLINGADATLQTVGVFDLSADPGSYAINGAAATLSAGHLLVADPGVYLITGADAALLAALLFSADPGAYLINGAPATLSASSQPTGPGTSIAGDTSRNRVMIGDRATAYAFSGDRRSDP